MKMQRIPKLSKKVLTAKLAGLEAHYTKAHMAWVSAKDAAKKAAEREKALGEVNLQAIQRLLGAQYVLELCKFDVTDGEAQRVFDALSRKRHKKAA
jgi:hypothetical protein